MTIPTWACNQWGQYEHDWLDCPSCIEAYEKWIEDPPVEDDTDRYVRIASHYGQ